MSQSRVQPPSTGHALVDAEATGHPRGTLVIVAIYAVLLVLGWVGLYVFQFLRQGAPHGH